MQVLLGLLCVCQLLEVFAARAPAGGSLLGLGRAAGRVGQHQPREVQFFTEDSEPADDVASDPLQPSTKNNNKNNLTAAADGANCHPTCVWQCSSEACNTHCRPSCQPPRCVTKCRRLLTSKCRNQCKAPKCAVVCPPAGVQPCEKAGCPECSTVCGKPECFLDCGRQDCESSCEEPQCTWSCLPEGCPDPQCQLMCSKSPCESLPTTTPFVMPHPCSGRWNESEPEKAPELPPETQLASQGFALPAAQDMMLRLPGSPRMASPMGTALPMANGASPFDAVGAMAPQPAPAMQAAPFPAISAPAP